MSERIAKTSNKVIGFFMALLGFACSEGSIWNMKVAYGAPSAFFIVKGNVVSSKDNTPVKGLQIIAKTSAHWLNQDTVRTDASGSYSTRVNALEVQQVNISVRDIDGTENGNFQPLDSIASFTNAKFTGGDGHWYQGTAETVMNIKMKPKP